MKLFSNAKGFSLLEVVVAISLLTLVFTGVMSLVTLTRESDVVNKNQLVAAYLAQEGSELVRYVRDQNYIEQASPFTNIATEIDSSILYFVIDYQGFDSIQSLESGDVKEANLLYIEANFYQLHGGPLVTPFRRLITTTYHPAAGPFPAYIDVKVDVYWKIDGKERIYSVESQLTDWR